MSDTPAVRCGGTSRTADAVTQRAARIAAGLDALGIRPGERVAVVLRNDVEYLEVSVGVGLLGAVPVPVNWHWKSRELQHLLEDSSARAVFVHTDLLDAIEGALAAPVPIIEVVPSPHLVDAFGLAADVRLPSGRYPELEEWLGSHHPLTAPAASAPMGVIYTSGTTGRPQGILRGAPTPEQRQQATQLVFSVFGMAPGMRTLVPAPLYHTAPYVHALIAVATSMDLTILPRFDAEQFLRTVQDEHIEHAQLVPTMFVRLLQLPPDVRSRYDLSSLRSVVHAAAPCPPAVKRAMIDWWGPIVREYYGGSETGAVVACDSAEWLAHPGTVGRPVADAAVQIHDARIRDADGALLPTGEVGEVFIRPPSCWPDFTYLGNPEKRSAMERDGYVSVGDVGHLDEDGFLHLSDRLHDMVISGGVNIYPAEIEQFLITLPGVRDVAVFGIPDERFGEALAAHLDVDPAAGLTEDGIRRHVRDNLAAYKVPRVVVFDPDLPREDSGKLFKRRIRERYLTGQ